MILDGCIATIEYNFITKNIKSNIVFGGTNSGEIVIHDNLIS